MTSPLESPGPRWTETEMTLPNWSGSEVVSVSKLNEMVDITPQKKVLFEQPFVPSEAANNARPTLPDWVFPLGIIPGQYLVVIFEANIFTTGTGHLELTINLMGLTKLWEDVTLPSSTTTYFRAINLANVSGLPVSDLTGLPVSLEVRRWVDSTRTLQQDFFSVLTSNSNLDEDHDFFGITNPGP